MQRFRECAGRAVLLGFLGTVPAALDEEEDPRPRVITDGEARVLLVDLDSRLGSEEPRQQAEALEELARHQNELLVSPAVAKLKSKNTAVVCAALRALGSQPFSKSRSTLLKWLKDPRSGTEVEVRVATVHALGRTGWELSGYRTLREAFDDAPREVKREMFRAFALQKEKHAFSLLVDHLEAPAPVNVHAANNPPESYWRERYQEWTYFRRDVERGLEALTGQKFASADEYVEWSRSPEARKAGFEYDRGS